MKLEKIIMKRYCLKITGLAILVAGIVIVGYILWSAASPDTGQTAQQDKSLTAQPNIEKPKANPQLKPEDFQACTLSIFANTSPC